MRLCVPSFPYLPGTVLRRLFGAGLGILLLVVQLVAPQPVQAAGGDWIEICGEYGVVEIQVNLDGTPVPNPDDCPDCQTCPLCALSHVAVTQTEARFAPLETATSVAGWHTASATIRNPAQYWHNTRGPPLATTKKTTRAPQAPTHNTGEVPCS